MKLYTEEALKKSATGIWKHSIDDILSDITPIELPSDEEIMNNAYTDRTVDDWEHEQQVGFELGAKWLKEQILNQNK